MATPLKPGGRPLTLEEWRATPIEAPPPPLSGSRLRERYEAPPVTIEEVVADLRAPWRRLAACRGMDTDVFFPERGASSLEAQMTCTWCPVRDECLAAALRAGDEVGIFGGTSARKRKPLLAAARAVERHVEKECAGCGETFTGGRYGAACSNRCSMRVARARRASA